MTDQANDNDQPQIAKPIAQADPELQRIIYAGARPSHQVETPLPSPQPPRTYELQDNNHPDNAEERGK